MNLTVAGGAESVPQLDETFCLEDADKITDKGVEAYK